MTGPGRYLTAMLMAIVMIAIQMLPAWSACHAVHHAATTAIAKTAISATAHHRATPIVQEQADVAQTESSDQQKPGTERCLGHCSCVCGPGGAFVPVTTSLIEAPRGVVLKLTIPTFAKTIGRMPDGPRRPPRTVA